MKKHPNQRIELLTVRRSTRAPKSIFIAKNHLAVVFAASAAAAC